ncbi:RICIN domain-containing protein [Streptomyces sp. NRRL F-5135]|uniref:RICIN domain-containing protein n=1 Tax=Streptomyces sp. NRRL F-5135 TaxID=1463858 RepID=UPI0006919A61|nr:RICIN domain-containing protein [Streptomyces sp. NRRL F-5135]
MPSRATVLAFAAAMSLFGAVGAADALPSSAAAIEYHTYHNLATGKCLDIRGASQNEGAVVQQFTCNSKDHQEFTQLAAAGGTFTLVARVGKKCVDVQDASTADGAGVRMHTCSGAASQRWTATPVATGAYQIQNVHSGKCLQDAGMPSGSRREVRQATCDGAPAQVWQKTLR